MSEDHIYRLVDGVRSSSQLERSRSLASLALRLKTGDCAPEDFVRLKACTSTLLSGDRWEERLGGLELARLLVKYGSDDVEELMECVCPARCLAGLLEDSEVRVRKAVAELLGDTSRNASNVWDVMGGVILESIERHYNRDEVSSSDTHDPTDDPEALESLDPISSLLQQSYRTSKPGVGEMRHDTEGWRCLETSFAALNAVMIGYGPSFSKYVQSEDGMAALIFKSAKHPNRFVREISQHLMGTLCDILDEDRICGEQSRMRLELSSHIGFGMSDNWSQVRYAASVAVRKFLMKASTEEHRALCLPLVLPQLCLNRYYVADGVRFYSQQTWQIMVKDEGKEWVAKCIQPVVSYYVEQSKANNHTVREAACSCISELVSKVDHKVVAPHIPRLLVCLLTSFRDASWPVRDAACLATGRCVVAFPEESLDVVEKLYKLWFAHLEDNVFSVREDAAVALGNAVRAYGAEASGRVREVLDRLLLKAKEQEAIERSTKAMTAPPDPKYTDQLMFSCGSLVPKLRRGVDCCGDYGLTRPTEPWESSDGAVYLVRELASVAPEDVETYMPMLAELGRLTHFSQYVTLHETLWKCLPDIAQSIGRAPFKRTMELFLDPMFRDAHCGHALCETAAKQCIIRLSGFVGRPIFAARLDSAQKAIFEAL